MARADGDEFGIEPARERPAWSRARCCTGRAGAARERHPLSLPREAVAQRGEIGRLGRWWEESRRIAGRQGEGDVVARAPDGSRLYRYGPTPAVGGATGDMEALALYAGQGAGIVKDFLPAAAVVEELVSGAAEALTRRYAGRMSSALRRDAA